MPPVPREGQAAGERVQRERGEVAPTAGGLRRAPHGDSRRRFEKKRSG